ncbi:hypothetical protein IK110_03825 [Candidatus Saccharibacteria bacterium]|nr:hypothetical protein [Candidatus Saccharibacteria bacterium]
MDAGDVELSGAVDFGPNDVGNKPKTQEAQNADNTVETAKQVASVKEEDIRFHSDNIRKREDMFVRVEGRERRKRAEERRKKYEQKQSLREAEVADRANKNSASKAVVESEKQLKKEQRRIMKEQREQENSARRTRFFAWAKKHWYLFAAVVVLVVAGIVAGIIISKHLERQRAEEAAIEEIVNYDAEVKAIEGRMWSNEDGLQPWTAVKEYDNLIAKLSTNNLKRNAYLSRSRLLVSYITLRTSDDKDEIINQAKRDIETAEKIDTTDQSVCWGSKLGELIGDYDYQQEYKKKCEEAAIESPVNGDTPLPDGFVGGRDD